MDQGEAIQHYRDQLMEANGTDFIPGTFQVPVSVAVVLVGSDYRIQRIKLLMPNNGLR